MRCRVDQEAGVVCPIVPTYVLGFILCHSRKQTVSQWQSRLQPAHMLRKLKFAAATSWGINARFLIVTQSVCGNPLPIFEDNGFPITTSGMTTNGFFSRFVPCKSFILNYAGILEMVLFVTVVRMPRSRASSPLKPPETLWRNIWHDHMNRRILSSSSIFETS
jgi:hypothetical protein